MFKPSEIRAGNAELLKLADVLDAADAAHEAAGEPAYDQRMYSHHCGTPACALGHARVMHGYAPEDGHCTNPEGELEFFGEDEAFALTVDEWSELFSTFGCENASTAKDAASYIRAFVSRRTSRLGAGE